jgi:hypothetical protein
MKKYSNLLATIIEDPSLIEESFFKQFYDDISDGIIKRWAKERSNDINFLNIIAKILE